MNDSIARSRRRRAVGPLGVDTEAVASGSFVLDPAFVFVLGDADVRIAAAAAAACCGNAATATAAVDAEFWGGSWWVAEHVG